MSILGLLGTEQLAAERFTSIRRKVFYFYPNGAAPLMGLLSLLEEEQANGDPDSPDDVADRFRRSGHFHHPRHAAGATTRHHQGRHA